MTLDEVCRRADTITRLAGADCDAEGVHSMEDDLYRDVLRAIASGADDAQALAAEAVRVADVEYPRWCA